MKKTIKALKFSVVLIVMVSSFVACDKDFNSIDSDVLGKENFNFATNNDSLWPVTAYNRKSEALQVNDLVSNLLGVFNDPAYGQTKASIITQITPTNFDPDFGLNPVIDSVIISIPYFNTVNGSDDDGFPTYRLDSLYGVTVSNPDPKIKLTIYENGYFLRDFDPNQVNDNSQNYYSNGASNTNTALNGSTTIVFDDHIVNPDTPILNIEEFIPSNAAIKTSLGEGENKVTTRSEPGFRYKLNNDFWTKTIIEKEGDPVLSNANNFHNYFRGLYFKAEAINPDGTMIQLNLSSSSANVTIYFKEGDDASRVASTFTMNFNGTRINTFINNYNLPLEDGDQTLGDQKIYLKGTEGSMGVVELFKGKMDCNGDGEIDALDCFLKTFRQQDDEGNYIQDPLTNRYLLKKIINEAHLSIVEDEDISTPVGDDKDYHFYDRIYAYDIKTNQPTTDYVIDQTENAQEPFNSKVVSLGQRNPDSGKYKIRITEYLNNILIRDSTNTKLGLAISTNVNYTSNAKILNSPDDLTEVPASTILSPRGTIVYGSKETSSKESKKLKLKIFFTESK